MNEAWNIPRLFNFYSHFFTEIMNSTLGWIKGWRSWLAFNEKKGVLVSLNNLQGLFELRFGGAFKELQAILSSRFTTVFGSDCE